MSREIYLQSEHEKPPTMTVGELMRALNQLNPNAPVVFKSPELGCFGPNTVYTIERASVVSMPAREEYRPGGISTDEETGETSTYDGWTDRWLEWTGVIIG